MSAASSTVDRAAAALVRRARAGDQNAEATLRRIGEEARKGKSPNAQRAFAAAERYIKSAPPEPFALGEGPPVVMQPPAQKPVKLIDPEMRKPPLPEGALDGLFNPKTMVSTILNASNYRYGLKAAAAVLATGPMLTKEAVANLGKFTFGSEAAARAYLYGTQFGSEKSFNEMRPHLDRKSQMAMVVGQCVHKARKLQALRFPEAKIKNYSSTAGWELGE